MANEVNHSVTGTSSIRTSSNSEFEKTESETINSCSSSSYSSNSDVDSVLLRLRSPTALESQGNTRYRVIHCLLVKEYQEGMEHLIPSQFRLKTELSSFQNLCVSNNKLFCNGCHEKLSLKSSVVNSHVKSQKHAKNKKWLL